MTTIPFPALVGLETAQQALLLLAVEPRLKGVVLAATAGTGKSSLARGMQALLDEGEVPFVEIPTSVDVENLLGGLNLEATLRKGEMVFQPGVLAKAHGGLAHLDGLNLLTDGSVNLLLSVLDQGEVRVEREGVSWSSPAQFNLIASYDPAEGPPRRHLLDRIGMLVSLPSGYDAGQRTAVIERNLRGEAASVDEDIAFLRGLVKAAREQLPNVTITKEQIGQLSVTALAYGVEGHRVDLFATWAACASAALNFRDEVEEEDLQTAVQLVVLPRATVIHRHHRPMIRHHHQHQKHMKKGKSRTSKSRNSQKKTQMKKGHLHHKRWDCHQEQVLEALETELPEEIESLPFQHLRRGRSGSRGSTEGKRGRHVRSVPGNPKQARIDVAATLRAASPWQQLRAANGEEDGRRVRLEMSDVRVKQYRSKAGALFCFAVDASGSMALHRMRQAKGAVNQLLMQAYVNRDRVALISFRGEAAELLMPPTQSVELARRALDLLPTGGGTPLASALLLGLDVAKQAESKGILQTVLILLTDGRANIGLQEDNQIEKELEQLGRSIAASRLRVVVVDTQRNYLSRGEARQLAEWLGGEYAYLPNANSEQLADLATTVASEL